MLRKQFFTILLISWTMFVTFSSLFSFEGVDTSGFHIPHADKLVHFTFYFVMAILWVFVLGGHKKKNLLRPLILAFLFSAIYGIFIEVLQVTLTENRHGDIWDAVANSLGALIGIGAIGIYIFRYGPLKWKY
ncbi:VanZ family protein [Maribacter sp. 2210JD10-5]|uniref:VanZ family protein n=1 Tax=Maribacter sp. 2210JD10-5 TaxID=3386272 RepID=UPI0039BC2580